MTLYVLSLDARRFLVFFFGDGPTPSRAYFAPCPERRGLHALVAVDVATRAGRHRA
jgi:hypothetical protein